MKKYIKIAFLSFIALSKGGASTLEQLNERMPHFMAHNIRAGQGFKQLLDDAVALRTDCAKRMGETDTNQYQITSTSYTSLLRCEEAFNVIKASDDNSRNAAINQFGTTLLSANVSRSTNLYAQWFMKAFEKVYSIPPSAPLALINSEPQPLDALREQMIESSLAQN
ncbi:MAG: hypothetical protein KBD31_05165 [Proteobacteria bacterium]|nr:hypothetical protein [Pseudomonadota bacterium]